MSGFIKLTNIEGLPIYVKAARIVLVEGFPKGKVATNVVLDCGDERLVVESAEQVLETVSLEYVSANTDN